jgi:N utilization substance protein A
MTDQNQSKRRVEEFKTITEKFIAALDVEEILAQLLTSEGFTSVKDIADSAVSEIAAIEGLDESIAEELINRAKDYSASHADAAITPSQINENQSKIDARISALPDMNLEIAIMMYLAEIKTLEDLADLAHDEFVEKLPTSGLTDEQVNDFIMAARNIVYFQK